MANIKIPPTEKTTYCIIGTSGRALVSDLRDEQLAVAIAEVYANYLKEQGKKYCVCVRKIHKVIEVETEQIFEQTNLPLYG